MDKDNTPASGSYLVAVIVFGLLYFFRISVVNPILAFTTVFPFVILADIASLRSTYADFLNFLTQFLFHKTPLEASTTNLIALFFLVIFILELLLRALQYLANKLGVILIFNWKHVVGLMAVIYMVAWFLEQRSTNDTEFIFFLTFYLFNIFSVFSFYVLSLASEELKQEFPNLGNIINP